MLKLSALEIYNETVVDLLNRDSGALRLLDDPEVKSSKVSSQTILPSSNLQCLILFKYRKARLWRS